MPRIFVAFRQEKVKGVPKRIATGGFTNIKKMLKEYPSTKWLVALYDFKANVENICHMLAHLEEVEADETHEFEVNSSGRLKEL